MHSFPRCRVSKAPHCACTCFPSCATCCTDSPVLPCLCLSPVLPLRPGARIPADVSLWLDGLNLHVYSWFRGQDGVSRGVHPEHPGSSMNGGDVRGSRGHDGNASRGLGAGCRYAALGFPWAVASNCGTVLSRGVLLHTPRDLPAGLNNMLAWRDANMPGKPVWVTEWGWDSALPGETCGTTLCVSQHAQVCMEGGAPGLGMYAVQRGGRPWGVTQWLSWQ